jgi:hypothetical protein
MYDAGEIQDKSQVECRVSGQHCAQQSVVRCSACLGHRAALIVRCLMVGMEVPRWRTGLSYNLAYRVSLLSDNENRGYSACLSNSMKISRGPSAILDPGPMVGHRQ